MIALPFARWLLGRTHGVPAMNILLYDDSFKWHYGCNIRFRVGVSERHRVTVVNKHVFVYVCEGKKRSRTDGVRVEKCIIQTSSTVKTSALSDTLPPRRIFNDFASHPRLLIHNPGKLRAPEMPSWSKKHSHRPKSQSPREVLPTFYTLQRDILFWKSTTMSDSQKLTERFWVPLYYEWNL